MVEGKRDLVLFTAEFPYGVVSETFLETEIVYLAQHFKRVFVLPSIRRGEMRDTPTNVIVEDCLAQSSNKSQKLKLAFSLHKWIAVYISEIIKNERRVDYFLHPKFYLDYLVQALDKASILNSFLNRTALCKPIFYDYWFQNSLLATSILKLSGIVPCLIARGHRFDIYEEEWLPRSIPFRCYQYLALDRLYSISQHGADYLYDQFGFTSKVSRLGVVAPMREVCQPKSQSRKTVVSCGGVTNRKGILKIPSVLKQLDFPVKWIHFGDGPQMGELKSEISKLEMDADVDLRGHVSNSDLLEFYSENWVDAFVTLSVSEGIPVSIMEAISFGIPVVALGVNGIPEVVTKETGVCLSSTASKEEISRALAQVVRVFESSESREVVKSFYQKHFSAGTNYRKFLQDVASL